MEGPVEVSGSESEVAGDEACGVGSTAGVFVGVAAMENWGRLGGGAAGTTVTGGAVSESEEGVVCRGFVGWTWWGCFFFRGFDTRGPKATVFFRRTLPLRRLMVCSDEE